MVLYKQKLHLRLSILLIFLIALPVIFRDFSSLVTESSNSFQDNSILSNTRISVVQQSTSPPKLMRFLDYVIFPEDLRNDPLSFDQWKANSHDSIPPLFMYDTLVEFDFKTGELIPALAKQWVVSNDSKYWFFTLRDDVFFHDGTKFNATAVKYNFERLIDPAHPAYIANESWGSLKSVTIISEYEIRIDLSESFSPFVTNIASSYSLLAPQSFNGSNVTEPIGTGPYKFEEVSHFDDRLVINFSRNENYFHGIPPFEEIQYIYYWEFEDWEAAILSQEGDLTGINVGISGVYGEIHVNSSYWEFLPLYTRMEIGHLSQNRSELTIPEVRQAINYAIDKDNYIPYSYNESVSYSIFAPSMPYFDSSIPGYPYNVQKANQLLDEAGFPKKEDGYRFDLRFIGLEGREPRYEVLIADLDTVGIRCELHVYPIEEVTNKVWEGDFDITVFGWGVNSPDPVYIGDFLHSSGVDNFGGYSNYQMDVMLEKAQETPVRQEREYYYKRVQNIAQEDPPFLLLQNWQMKHLRAGHIAPFVTFQRNGRISFNYSQIMPYPIKFRVNDISSLEAHFNNYVNSKIYTYTDVHVTNYSLYFPFVDAILTNLGCKDGIIFNVRMSYEFQSFSSSHKGRGKFYEIKTNLVNGDYLFRCYYDPQEVEGFTVDHLYEFDDNSNSWVRLETHASNISLRFIEVHLKADYKLLRVGEAILQTTYTFMPFIMLFLGTVVSLGTTTILINRYMINQIKEKLIFH